MNDQFAGNLFDSQPDKRKGRPVQKGHKWSIVENVLKNKWSVVKDLNGLPSHKEGGVDLQIHDGKVLFKHGPGYVHAKEGLVIKAQGGLKYHSEYTSHNED
jgi:hypothetical protein